MTNTTTPNESRASFDTGAAALWASAMVILAMIITTAGRLGTGNSAMADTSSVSDITVLTASATTDADVLGVLDGRAEKLYMYGVTGARTLELYQVEDLQQLFLQARASAGGRR